MLSIIQKPKKGFQSRSIKQEEVRNFYTAEERALVKREKKCPAIRLNSGAMKMV